MQSLTPNLAVKDVKESIVFYRDVLDFTIQMAVPEDKSNFSTELDESKKYIWAMMKNATAEVMFQEKESFSEDIGVEIENIGASMSLYFKVDDLDALYAKISSKVDIVKELYTTWYGMREFYIKDCNGYILGFGSQSSS